MTTAAPTEIDLERLIEPHRIHASLYTDPAIWEAELERIWYRTWVFVGHESEISEPNDYVVKAIGPQPVIMVRGSDGEIRLLLNRCTHRGNLVCEDERGNSSAFRCPYHGWTFSNTGKLLGYPFNSGYGGTEKKKELGLGRVPRVESYRGFIFGSFAEDGPTLKEHLGAASEAIDRLCSLSPEGEVEVTAGWLKHKVKANWKLVLENETDGYHPQFVHASIFDVAESPIAALYGEKSVAVARDLGDGHTENDLRPAFRRLGNPLQWFDGASPEKFPDYAAKMRAAYGEQAEQIMIDGAPHVMIFPNLFLAEIQIFVLQPTAIDETVQHVTAVQLKGAPELNQRLLRKASASVGPAGFLLADDSEMYERNQRGVQARTPEWLEISRGMHRERTDEQGFLCGDATDEVPLRGIYRHYRQLMEAGQ